MFGNITDSEQFDELLGFGVEGIETELLKRARELLPNGDINSWGAKIHDGNQTWVGLHLSTLQTPYLEIREMFDLLNPSAGEKVVDLGAGYGRLGLWLKVFYPEVDFVGYEYVKERVLAGSRILHEWGCSRALLLEQDLTHPEFILPEADYYFIYDYGKIDHIRHTLDQLDRMADRRMFKVIARGQGSRSLIEKEYPWLSQVHPPHHTEKFSIYSMSL